MTTFESSVTIFAVTAIVFILVIGMVTIVNKLKEIIDRQYANWEQLRKIETHTNYLPDISRQLDNIEDNSIDEMEEFIRNVQGILDDLAINVKGNYNTLEQQQESLNYIRMRVSHILSLMHPAEEVVKPDAPTALDGLSNVQKDNANKSTNYNGYDPTIIVKGSETTNKED